MNAGKSMSGGLLACEEALQRLLDGKPVVPEHVGLELSKITASIVSLEAGFDRGYLKKSRKAHLPILAKIEASRAEANKSSGSSSSKKLNAWKISLCFWKKSLQWSVRSVTGCLRRISSYGSA